MTRFFPHTIQTPDGLTRLRCTTCGQSVSTPFLPVPTDTPDKGLIVRAIIQCPDCIEKIQEKKDASARRT